MQVTTKFDIGDKVKCRITGFEGIVVGFTRWITGCDTYGIRPSKVEDGKYPEAKWFDTPQLELVEAEAVDLMSDKEIGGPHDEPQSPAHQRS